MSTNEALAGTLLLDRYELGEVIGSGGMAFVCRAVDKLTGNDVAVKILKPEFNDDAEFVKRFQREAIASQTMQHPNIIKVLDVGEQNNMRFIVMEYVDGITIKDIVAAEGALDVKRAIDYAIQTARAIEHAHRCHIIHRDIKSQNIIVDRRGIVKVADFGIARATNSATYTENDAGVLGSVHYFSPEQANGEIVDEKSDIYSLGVVLYEMAAGRLPFEGDQPIAVALGHIRSEPELPSSINPLIPKALNEVILKALNKNKFNRYASAIQMELDLSMVLTRPQGGFVDDFARKQTEQPEQSADGQKRSDGGQASQAAGGSAEHDAGETRRVKSALSTAAMLSGAALLILLCLAFFWQDLSSGDVMSFDYTGMYAPDAAQELISAGYAVHFVWTCSETVARDYIVEQDMINGKTGANAVLSVSLGPESAVMPDLSGMDVQEAKRLLYNLGLNVSSVVKGESGLVGENQIYAQEPLGGSGVLNSSEATIYVNTPPKLVHIPKTIGLSQSEAEIMLEANGLACAVEYAEYTDVLQGIVTEQDPPADQEAYSGTTVTITVSRSPESLANQRIDASFSVDIAEAGEVVATLQTGGESVELLRFRCLPGTRTFYFSLFRPDADSRIIIRLNRERVYEHRVAGG